MSKHAKTALGAELPKLSEHDLMEAVSRSHRDGQSPLRTYRLDTTTHRRPGDWCRSEMRVSDTDRETNDD